MVRFKKFDLTQKEPRIKTKFKATKQKYYSYKQEIEKITNFDNHPEDWKKQLWIYLSPNKERKEKGWKLIEL